MGYLRKALEKGYLEALGPHAVLTTCLRFSSVLGGAPVACCLFLSTGSYHVCIQIHATPCCFPRCTTETFGVQKSALWGCELCEGELGGVWYKGQKASYSRFAATCYFWDVSRQLAGAYASSSNHLDQHQQPLLIRDHKMKWLNFGSTPDEGNLSPHPGFVWMKAGYSESILWCKVRLTKQRNVDLTPKKVPPQKT